MKHHRQFQGHSMVEVLIIVGLMVALVSMLLPFFEKSINSAKYAVCTNNLHQIYIGNQTRAITEGKLLTFPIAYNWQTEVESVLENSGDLMCPLADPNNFKSSDHFTFLSEPPPSIANKQLESDTKFYVFREKENFELTQDVNAIVDPGYYGSPYRGATTIGFNSNGVISEGTKVDVFYFHFDGITTTNGGSLLQMIFGAKVLGFIGRGDELNATDALLGLESVQYQPLTWRGVEKNNGPVGDAVELPEGKGHLNYTTSKTVVGNENGTDGIRVITDIGGGSNYGMNLEVPTAPSSEMIFLADSHVPVIDFDKQNDNDHTFEEALDPRHEGKVNVVLTDGSVKLMDPSEIQPNSSYWRK